MTTTYLERVKMTGKADKRARKNPADLRWGERKGKDLQEMADEMKRQVATIEAQVAVMSELGITALKIDGITKGATALKTMWDFLKNVENAITDKRLGG